MKRPPDIAQLLLRRFDSGHRDWLAAASVDQHWPMIIALGLPTEQEAQRQVDAVRAWVAAWAAWQGAGELAWVLRQWKVLGAQRLPATLTLRSPAEVASWIGQQERWLRATRRYEELAARWPALATRTPRLFGVLADYSDPDFARLVDMLAWLGANPASGLYPRQLPLAGIDSKWIEARKAVLMELVALLRQVPDRIDDFYQLCGLKKPPAQLRMRILDQRLRSRLGGLGDITAPLADIAALDLPASIVIVVENLQTGLAFADIPGAVVFMALGYSVDLLEQIPWIAAGRCIYWGDIDTHGFAILNRARSCLPAVESVLMDKHTLLRFAPLWTDEKVQHGANELPLLTESEHSVYRDLKCNVLAQHLRLEQERISWDYAWEVLTSQCGRENNP
ncbi:MAG: Wadjet anti-phage system protein JetD domain-containing protein [Pseudomonadota bacterium]